MKSFKLACVPLALALPAALPHPAMAQIGQGQSGPGQVGLGSGGQAVASGNTLLTVSGEGRARRTPDLAIFSAGVTSQAATAGMAMTANAADMNKVIAALKRAGIPERDIQTSQIGLNPVYGDQRPGPDGTIREPRIVGYQASNTVSVQQRDLGQFGKVLDTLVSAGANQINGPSFQLDNPDSALDEARVAAVRSARARAELYAKAAGLRVMRILTIAESGGYAPPQPMLYAKAALAMDAAPTPVAAGQVELNASVTVQFELAP